MNYQIIPSTHYLPLKTLKGKGLNPHDLKCAAEGSDDGFQLLVRWNSKKTRRAFYKSRNLTLALD